MSDEPTEETEPSTADGRDADPRSAAGLGPEPPTAGADRFPDDPELRDLLRAVGDDVRGESSESRQLAAIRYRTADLYDADEETPSGRYTATFATSCV